MEEISVHFVEGEDCMGHREAYWRAMTKTPDGSVVMRCATSAEDAKTLLLQTLRPRIVCLCGSTRFKEAFDEANYQETMAGRIVLSVGFFMHATGNRHGESVGATPAQKIALDELHLRKIDLADEVLVLNVGRYIGDSTRREVAYAVTQGKPVRFLEEVQEVAPTTSPSTTSSDS